MSGAVVKSRRATLVAVRQEARSREAGEESAFYVRQDRHVPAPAGINDGETIQLSAAREAVAGRSCNHSCTLVISR